MVDLPPFLEPLGTSPIPHLPYRNATFNHKNPLGPAHALWWPNKSDGTCTPTVLIFIPGNPGLLDFYIPFLSAIFEKDASGRLAIFAHAHVGHTPGLQHTSKGRTSSYGLTAQVQSAIEAFDAVKSTFGPQTTVVLAGHSVGSWVSLQVLKARPASVSAAFLLFPTISGIASTPNGRRLSWLFHPPLPRIIATLSYVTRLFPIRLLSVLFPSWPLPQLLTLRTLLHSPECIYAAFCMAHDEMKSICELDTTLLREHSHRLWVYFAKEDDWVGGQKDILLRSFEADHAAVRVAHGHPDIPHAFCINHGEQLADQCHEWLSGFM